MKIVFLDIDGVLNSDRSTLGAQARHRGANPTLSQYVKHDIDPVAVDLVNYLCQITEAWIVVSSSHRLDFYEDGEFDMKSLKKYMSDLGISPRYIMDCIPYMPSHLRGEEIDTWLTSNRFDTEIDSYVILDDSSDMLPDQDLNFVHTDPKIGFSVDDYYAACKILR